MAANSTIGERIKELVNHFANGNNSQFAKMVNVNEANIRSYYNGTLPKFDVLSNIATTFEINCEWLLTGKGNMLIESGVENINTSLKTVPLVENLTQSNETKDPHTTELLIDKIEAQAKTIGRLEYELEQLKNESHSRVGAEVANRGVGDVGCADVG